jgi:excisionase family DNA binding protein
VPVNGAELARVSTRAIYRAIQRGELRAVRLCSRLRIPREAFDEWVERCTVQPPAPRVVAFPPPTAADPWELPRAPGAQLGREGLVSVPLSLLVGPKSAQ